LARLETGAMRVEPGESDLAGLLRRTIEQIMPVLVPRGSALQFDSAPDAALLIAIDLEDAEALVWRVLASIAAACGPEEHLTVSLAPLIGAKGALARMTATLPAALAAEDNLFAATARTAGSAVTPGLFGAGFALRLARAEARGAGGELVRDGDTLVLTLPLLTGEPGLPSLDVEGHTVAGT
jgi:two-component system, OmpR family, sensor kinase